MNTKVWWLPMARPQAKARTKTGRRAGARSMRSHRYRASAPNMAFSPKTSAVAAWCQTSGLVPKSPAASKPAAAIPVHSCTVAQSRPAAAAVDTAESRFTRHAMEGPKGRAANSRASKAKMG